MEEIEVPTEQLHETLHEHAEHAAGANRWLTGVALSSALIAALAAIAALFAGGDANQAILLQMKASNQWNYYQAKGVKMNVLSGKLDLLTALGKETDAKDRAKVEQYREEQTKIREDADELQKLSAEHLESHETMAHAVTIFQVAIAVGAIAALARKRAFWYVSLAATVFGLWFFISDLSTHARLQHADAALEEKEKAVAAK